MVGMRNKIGACAVGLCVTLLALVECERYMGEVDRLIRVPYPEKCSVSHVRDAFNGLYGLEDYLEIDEDPSDDDPDLANAKRRLTSYLHLLHDYCNRMLGMTLAKGENVRTLRLDHGDAIEISQKLVRIQRDRNLAKSEFLSQLQQFLASKAAQKSISKEEVLVRVKESARLLARRINVEMAPVVALGQIANNMDEEASQEAPEVGSPLARHLEKIHRQCSDISQVTMDRWGQLRLIEYTPEEPKYLQSNSGLVPLDAQVAQQVTVNEGYQKKFDELATGV